MCLYRSLLHCGYGMHSSQILITWNCPLSQNLLWVVVGRVHVYKHSGLCRIGKLRVSMSMPRVGMTIKAFVPHCKTVIVLSNCSAFNIPLSGCTHI